MSRHGDSRLYKNNREILRRRAKLNNAPCYYCGMPFDRRTSNPYSPLAFTADHVIPREAGGSDRMENLVPAHFKCNRAKGVNLVNPMPRNTRKATRIW